MNGAMNGGPPVSFSNMVGPKRRRMRSGGNVSTITNNTPKDVMSSSIDDEKTVQTSKCKGATTIPIFLKSTLLYYLLHESQPGAKQTFVRSFPDSALLISNNY